MMPKRGVAGHADVRLAGGGGRLEEIAAERLEAGLVDEIGDGDLPDLLRLRLPGIVADTTPLWLTVTAVAFAGTTIGGVTVIAVDGDDLAIGVGAERAGARVNGFAGRGRDLIPAASVDRQIERVAGIGQRALDVELRIAAVRTPRPICAPSGTAELWPRLETPLRRSA